MAAMKNVYHNILQHVIVDKLGNIITSKNTLFNIEVGSKIQDFHPFFLSILDKPLDTENKIATYKGVCFVINNEIKFCDLIIKQEFDFNSITIFNYTSNYCAKQCKTQIENEEKLKSSLLKSNNHPSLL